MRVSTLQTFNTSVSQMQKGQTNLVKLQEQIATGKRLLRPSDDPVAASQVLKLERELARLEQFDKNIDVSRRRLEQQELVLDNINLATERLRELSIQAGSGTLTDNDRRGLATEMRQLQDEILGLMNTQDVQGEFLFGGSRGLVQPFVRNPDNTFSYQGDDGQRSIQVGPKLLIGNGDSGRDVFEVISDDIQVAVLGGLPERNDLSVVVDNPTTSAFRDFADINGDLSISIINYTAGAPPTYDYSITNSSGAVLSANIGQQVGTPIALGGLSIDYTGTASPVTLSLRAQEDKHSLLQTVEELATILETPVTNDTEQTALNDALAKGLNELAEATEANLLARAQLGSRQVSLDRAEQANADAVLFNQTALSQLQDLDFTQAISDLTLQQTALQAAQQVFARVSGLSLFNVL